MAKDGGFFGQGRAPEDFLRHSSYYHRRYEGFTEAMTRDADGRQVLTRVYTGDWRNQELSPGKRAAVRAGYAALFLVCAGLFLLSALADIAVSRALFAQFLQFLTVCALLALLSRLFVYMLSPRWMTAWQYASGPAKVKQWSRVAAVLLLLQAAAAAASPLLGLGFWGARVLGSSAGYLAAACAAYLVFRVESGVVYLKTPSGNQPPAGGFPVEG